MLHLARKAFHPCAPPFPLLHVDTTWKFPEMYEFRDRMAEEHGMELLVHVNRKAWNGGSGRSATARRSTPDVMKTQALRQGAREVRLRRRVRAERGATRSLARQGAGLLVPHRRPSLGPRRQRPELWRLYNPRVNRGESIRVFPLSD